jgi:diguanylate cyclase
MRPRTRRAVLEEARAFLQAAREARIAGDHRLGVEQATRALSLAEASGQQGLKAAALSVLALNQFRLSDSESAIRNCQLALPLLKRSRDAAERTQVLCTLVMAHNDMGLHADSLVYATQAMDSARSAGDPSLMSWALNRAGLTYEELGDPARGEPLMLRALEIAREIEGQEEMFSALNNLASNLLHAAKSQQGELARATLLRARQYGLEALTLAEASGNAHRQAVCLGNLANAQTALGDYAQALSYIERQAGLAQQNGYRGMALTALSNRAELERHRGDLDAAIRLFNQALAAAHDTDDHAMLFEMHQGLYESHKQRGDMADALRHHEAMLPLEREEMKQRADRQARMLLNRIEVEQAQALAERAKLDAEVQRLRASQLESENQRLASKAIELGKHAMEDQLTGLANRRRVDHELPVQLAFAHERQSALSVAAVDLDHFKQVNDRFGHAVGDDVLRAIARVLTDNTRSSDVLARMGGEEFLVLFVGTPLAVAADICERLRRAVEGHGWHQVAPGLQVTISVGLCDATHSQDMRALLERADASLYAAKRAGRNRIEVAAPPAGAQAITSP